MAEWLKAPHSKCGILARVSGVRIPPSPPRRRRPKGGALRRDEAPWSAPARDARWLIPAARRQVLNWVSALLGALRRCACAEIGAHARSPARHEKKGPHGTRVGQEAKARSGRHRQLPHGGAARYARPHRVVVLPALRFRSGVLAPAGRQRGKGLLRRRAGRARSPASRPICATPRSCRPLSRDGAGNAVRITDFAPRFMRFERVFNPPQIFRRIEPIAGLPRIKIRVRPTFNYGGPCATAAIGSNHIRYTGGADTLRLTTDAALSYIAQRDAVCADQAGDADPRGRTSRSKPPSTPPRASSSSARATTGSTGCARSPCRWNTRPTSSAPPSR